MHRIIEIAEEGCKTEYRIQKSIGIGKIGFWRNLWNFVGLYGVWDYIKFDSAEKAEKWLNDELNPRIQKIKIGKVIKKD